MNRTPNQPPRRGDARPSDASVCTYRLGGVAMSDIKITTESVRTDAQSIIEAYRAGDAKIKASIRTGVDKIMKAAIDDLDIELAKIAKDLAGSLVTVREVAKIDYAELVARRVAALSWAIDDILTGAVRPDGLPEDFVIDADMIKARVEALADSTDGNDVMAESRKIARTKIAKSVDRHDVGEWISRAFADVAVGTRLTVAQIITRGIIAGDAYRPSAGAIKARLVGGADGCTVAGVRGDATDGQAYGGVKIS